MVETARLTDNTRKSLERSDKVAQPLIREGVYELEEEFLRDYARHQAEEERQAVLGFERQFISWEKFNDAIMNIATPEQEDIAFEWESARMFLASWQKLLKELGQAAPVPDGFEQSP